MPKLFYPAVIILIMAFLFSLQAQERPNSPVFKKYRTGEPTTIIKTSDLTYQLWEGFMLMKNANAGEAASQHELALRYFLGKGFPADTVRAAFWLKKAAAQDFMLARYNLGIFLYNGYGVDWNPFLAFFEFRAAAESGMPDGQYVFGLIFTDNLVVHQDFAEAQLWIQRAADGGYEPAKDLLEELKRKGLFADRPAGHHESSPGTKRSASPAEPLLLDFSVDTSRHVDDQTILQDVFRNGNEEIQKLLGISKLLIDSTASDTALFRVLQQAAAIGNPDASTVIGRCYERGIGVRADPVAAAENYVHAISLGSRHAYPLMTDILHSTSFVQELDTRLKRKDPAAEFVWASLAALHLDTQIPEREAFRLLEDAASKNHLLALIELGVCYNSGRWTTMNKKRAYDFWQYAEVHGSKEAGLRLASARVVADTTATNADIQFLLDAAQDGSLLAQLTLAYCYEEGIRVPRNPSRAVHFYRLCARRGSDGAYLALKRMHDTLRPVEQEFSLDKTEKNRKR
ncbi:MAG: tetratricopeptide repeat protein [Ignavibacteriales bacterium]|nr:tetratricopeptide repeat protein [Ignavibacteriales bacterium]